MDDSTPVLISTGDGPGSSPGEPLALVIDPGTTSPEPEPPKKKQKTNGELLRSVSNPRCCLIE